LSAGVYGPRGSIGRAASLQRFKLEWWQSFGTHNSSYLRIETEYISALIVGLQWQHLHPTELGLVWESLQVLEKLSVYNEGT
jgi:hypothetical protein